MNEFSTVISVEGGKYTFKINAKTGAVTCDRFGEPWMEFDQGSKALIALLALAENQAAVVEAARATQGHQSFTSLDLSLYELRHTLDRLDGKI